MNKYPDFMDPKHAIDELRYGFDSIIRERYFMVPGRTEESFSRWYYRDGGPYDLLGELMRSLDSDN